MTDMTVAQTLVVGHLWQSIALAVVLAGALSLGRRMRGSTRYGLAGAAFLVSLALPLAAFIPGETLVTSLMKQLDAPVASSTPQARPAAVPSRVKFERPQWANAAIANGAPPAAIDLGAQALRTLADDKTPVAETFWGKEAINDGAPEWALNLARAAAGAAMQDAATSAAPPTLANTAAPAVATERPVFTLPTIALPDLSGFALPLALVWVAGSLILLLRTARDLIAVERLVARAKPAELPEALKRRMGRVLVATSTEAPGPMAAGLFRPCIVLPESIALGSPGMAALLEHERAHIERRDMLAALGQRVMLSLLWWSPALHWMSRRMDEEREVACDEQAVERTGDAKAFARSLTKQAENQLWARAPKLAVGAIGPRSHVGRRIRRLIDLARSGVSPAAKYSGRLAFAGLALAVGIAAMVTPRLVAEAQQTPKLDGGPQKPIDITKPQDRDAPAPLADADRDRAGNAHDPAWTDSRKAARDAARARADLDQDDAFVGLTDDDLRGLGDEIRELMKSVGSDIKVAFADMSPDIDTQLQGLSADMAALGVEISGAVSQQILSELPGILEEVRQTLKEQGIDAGDLRDFKGLSSKEREELRANLAKVRKQLHEQLGAQVKEQIKQAVLEARAEIAAHRGEIAAAVKESNANSEAARQALDEARKAIEAARARGDFDTLKNFDQLHFNGNFPFDKKQIEALKELGRQAAKWNKDPVSWDRSSWQGESGGETSANWRLMRAASRGDFEATKTLIRDEHASPNVSFPGEGTPLMEAARAGSEETTRALLEAGADANRAMPGQGTALTVAVRRGEAEVAKALLDRGANPNVAAPGAGTPLGNAARQGDLELVKLLVERGASVNQADRSYGRPQTALNLAEKYGNDDIADYLRSKGAK